MSVNLPLDGATRFAPRLGRMKHSFPHDLDTATARNVTDKAFASYAERFPEYKPQMRWVSDHRAEAQFTAKGITLRGSFEITPRTIDMSLDVPLLLRPFSGRAVGVIEEQIKKWVAKAKAGEI